MKMEEILLEEVQVMEEAVQPAGCLCGLGCIAAGAFCGWGC